MTPHDHTTIVAGCYRCELGRDEAASALAEEWWPERYIGDLTAADWAASDFTNRFFARNKGSHGRRVKTIVVSNPTAKLYRRYFNEHRVARGGKGGERSTSDRLIAVIYSVDMGWCAPYRRAASMRNAHRPATLEPVRFGG